MGSTVPFWFDAFQQCVWWTLLHADWLSRAPCCRRIDLAFDSLCTRRERAIFERASRRLADLRPLLDVCRGFMARTLQLGLSPLMFYLTGIDPYDNFAEDVL